MANRRSRSSRRLTLLGVAVALVLALTLLAGVVTAAHRDPAYRRSVNASFAAAASAIVESSNVTGRELAVVMGSPGAFSRTLLESRLQGLDQRAEHESLDAQRLAPPPPDANAYVRIVDTMRLRAAAVDLMRAALEGLLVLTPSNPAGTAGAEPDPVPRVGVLGASRLLRYSGEQLVEADGIYRGLPVVFASVGGATLPPSRWTSPSTNRLMPTALALEASAVAGDPTLAATVRLSIAAVQTQPLLLPLGPGYPIPPTLTFLVAVSVRNSGTAPSPVVAVISVRPTGRIGRSASGRAVGAVAAGGAVALQLPAMPVVPGEHCLVTIQILRPRPQATTVGLRWSRNVVVGQSAPAG